MTATLLLGLSGCGGGAHDAPATDRDRAPTPKVLLIGIDGVRLDILDEVRTPNIDRLRQGGSLSVGTTTTPSVSGPAWSSMLTGVWPDKHGVMSNEFTVRRFDIYPDFLSRVESVRPDLSTFAVADWPPLMTTSDGSEPTIGNRIDVREALDGYALGWAEADERGVELAEVHLRENDPDAVFVYLGNPDETSHEHGSIGAEYRDALALSDEHVGRLVAAVAARPTLPDEDWLILVSTDHGRRPDGGHGGDTPEEMATFLLTSGPSALQGRGEAMRIVDVAATALVHLGIELDPSWELDGAPVGLR